MFSRFYRLSKLGLPFCVKRILSKMKNADRLACIPLIHYYIIRDSERILFNRRFPFPHPSPGRY